MASARWTLRRVLDALSRRSTSAAARKLAERAEALSTAIGPGPARRPDGHTWGHTGLWIAEAIEAMAWVADERGLGGERVLDGLSWDLAIDEVWEAWVRSLSTALAPRLGLVPVPPEASRRPLRWRGRLESLTSLAPDAVLRGPDRAIVFEAKYKAHFQLLARQGWRAQAESLRAAHRADLHQALAYAALHDVSATDIVLVYPSLAETTREASVASVVSGRRAVRVWLVELPFGFTSPDGLREHIERWAAWFRDPPP